VGLLLLIKCQICTLLRINYAFKHTWCTYILYIYSNIDVILGKKLGIMKKVEAKTRRVHKVKK